MVEKENKNHKITLSLIFGYFIVYSALGFRTIFEARFLTWRFIIVLLFNIAVIFVLFKIPKISNLFKPTSGLRVVLIILFIGTLSLHIFSAIMHDTLGVSEIEISSEEIEIIANPSLSNVNIILLVILFFGSLISGIIIDKTNKEKVNRKYIFLFFMFIVFFIIDFALWLLLNVLSFYLFFGGSL